MLIWNKLVLFHLVLVVEHKHNFVEIIRFARVNTHGSRNKYDSSWTRVLYAELGSVSINARCLASAIKTWSLTPHSPPPARGICLEK